MPELPEVETVVRDLRPHVVGRRIVAVRAPSIDQRTLRKPWQADWAERLRHGMVEAVVRRGKWIVIEFADGAILVVHLGMTGQLTVRDADAEEESHTHLVFDLDDGRSLRFRDIRRFGSATVFSNRAGVEAAFAASGLGPEPFDVDGLYWRERLAGTTRCLKAILLDQQVVAGVGNIYADESLFRAKLNPAILGRDVGRVAADRLRRSIAWVLTRAIEQRGSSIRNYVGGSGLRGDYQHEFRVYGRGGQPCPRCRTPIERTRLAGRATHFCPRCQPANSKG